MKQKELWGSFEADNNLSDTIYVSLPRLKSPGSRSPGQAQLLLRFNVCRS